MATTIPRTIPFILGSTDTVLVAPTATTGFAAVARFNGAQVSWAGATGATAYTLTATATGTVPRSFTFTGPSPVALTGLANGTLYTLSLVARNGAGSNSAVTTTVTPSAGAVLPGSDGTQTIGPAPIVPAAPAIVSVTSFDASALVVWTPPVDDGGSGVTGYQINAALADGTVVLTRNVGANVNSANLGPLVNSTLYSVTVLAINGIGPSPASNPVTVTPLGGGGVIPDDGGTEVPVHTPVDQPAFQAFPLERLFHPDNWGLTVDEVDAR